MSETEPIPEVDAIRQVIAESGAMDYIDVVNAVFKRFRINVSATDVERVAHEMVSEKTMVKPRAQVSLDLSANLPTRKPTPSGSNSNAPAGPDSDHPESDMDHALHFVKSVGGLARAKRLLSELEAIFVGRS